MSDERKQAFEVKWRIENLKSWFVKRDDSLYSPQFRVEMLSNTCWKLRLSPNLHSGEKYISLAILRDIEDDRPEQIAVSYELSFLSSDGSSLNSKSCTTKFSPKSVSKELNMKEAQIFDEKEGTCLPEGVLTVCCKMWKAWSEISIEGQCSIQSVIGKKCLTLDGTLDYLGTLHVTNDMEANFVSHSSDINFMSFRVKKRTNHLDIPYYNFIRSKVKCISLNVFYCELFVVDGTGQKKSLYRTLQNSLLISDKSFEFNTQEALSKYKKNNTVTLQLDITFYPGVESESIEYNVNKYNKLTGESALLKNMDCSSSEKVRSFPADRHHLSDYKDEDCDIEESQNEENEYDNPAGKRCLPITTLREDLTSLYNDSLFCDINLLSDNETFPAHRSVLCARSPVFKKMFTTDMKEKGGECVKISDISSDTVRRMLQFLYTDCSGDLDMQSAKDLYIAADKYDIASLKQRCSSFMKKNLSPANVCEVLVLADMHRDKNLESIAQEYILINDEEVFYSDEWKLFMKNYGGLAAQVMYLKFTKR